jgi:imidazoleglycerol-phosphate dehydratase
MCDVKTGCGFLDHMLELFTRHGRFNLTLRCEGDAHVDFHHTTEDVAIALGSAFSRALGDRAGINRYGSFILPMDEALAICATDICGRATLVFDARFETPKVGDFDTELIKEFFAAFARKLGAAIHLRLISGENSHHIAEALFKGFARALSQAVAADPKSQGEIPSTKGVIL